jgi:hypothetical protein
MVNDSQDFPVSAYGSRRFRSACAAILLFFILVFLILAPASAVSPAGTGELRIMVREADTGNVTPNALVYLDGTAAGLTSASDGSVLLHNIDYGEHSVRVTRGGSAETTKIVDVTGNQSLTVYLSHSKVVPIIVNGPPEGRIDIVFVASKTQYDCPDKEKVTTDTYTSDQALFRQDVNNLIAGNYLRLDQYTSGRVGLPSDYRDRFNFYYYWDKDNFADAFDGCAGTLPDHFWEDAPFADVAVILYPTYTGLYTGASCEPDGCASGLGPGTHTWVKVPTDGGKLILHESGHAVFGLIDTYCGDTYYIQNDPVPNVWDSRTACRRSAADERWNSSACGQITGPALAPGNSVCSEPFWAYDPEPDIMGIGVYSYAGKFGEAETTRIDYILNTIGGAKTA